MLCEKCNKNEANIRYTEIINGEKREIMLCENCSHKIGLDNISFNMPIDFSSFCGGVVDNEEHDKDTIVPVFKTIKQLRCNSCNMTYDEFINIGKFGCEECYKIFSPKVDSLLKRIHGNNKHVGRKSLQSNVGSAIFGNSQKDNVGGDAHIDPQKCNKENQLEKLQNDLKKAIADERYEDAAKIRDEIKRLKGE